MMTSRKVRAGGADASPAAVSRTGDDSRRRRTAGLTERELEVVVLVTEGLTNDQIAEKLVLSPRTVQSHVANAMRRTRTQSRTQLAVLSIREGLVSLEPEPE